ncbi:hypothetical protein B0H14DRAFT_3595745 [Mycena olivaceomarginata]|nr:hypothetical protein B0H14DRAFT_3595745 [Mycena olivaceomarginata]
MDPFALRIRSLGPSPPPPPSTPVGNTAENHLMTLPTVSPDYLHSLGVQYLVDTFYAPPDTYLHLFCAHFLGQVPLIHAPTWNMEDTLPILARVFHACGALFAKTSEGAVFAEAALESVTPDIMAGLGKAVNSLFSSMWTQESGTNISRGQFQLPIALILLKTTPLFQRERETLLQHARSWRAPDWSIDPGALESAWIEWAEVETIKRALLFDMHPRTTAQGTYFVWPAEMEMEIELLPLPCDDTLWCTQSAAEWSTACVQDALAARAVPPDTDPTEAVLLPPFGLFILIRAIL